MELYNKPLFFFPCLREKCKKIKKMLIKQIRPKYNIQWNANKIEKKYRDLQEIFFGYMRERILNTMEENNISQAQLARIMGVSRQRIHQLLHKNDTSIGITTLKRIEKALEVRSDNENQ